MFLREARFVDLPEQGGYPFNLPAFHGARELRFNNTSQGFFFRRELLQLRELQR